MCKSIFLMNINEHQVIRRSVICTVVLHVQWWINIWHHSALITYHNVTLFGKNILNRNTLLVSYAQDNFTYTLHQDHIILTSYTPTMYHHVISYTDYIQCSCSEIAKSFFSYVTHLASVYICTHATMHKTKCQWGFFYCYCII